MVWNLYFIFYSVCMHAAIVPALLSISYSWVSYRALVQSAAMWMKFVAQGNNNKQHHAWALDQDLLIIDWHSNHWTAIQCQYGYNSYISCCFVKRHSYKCIFKLNIILINLGHLLYHWFRPSGFWSTPVTLSQYLTVALYWPSVPLYTMFASVCCAVC